MVKRTISTNPDIFDDFPLASKDINSYVQHLFEQNPKQSKDPNIIKKIGLLYGFPKEAVLSFANYNNEWVRFHRYIKKRTENAFHMRQLGIKGQTEEEYDIMLHLSYLNREGKVQAKEGFLEDFISTHQDETKRFLDKVKENEPHLSITDKGIDYIMKRRGVYTHGFAFGSMSTPEDYAFKKRIDEIYRLSGMNAAAS